MLNIKTFSYSNSTTLEILDNDNNTKQYLFFNIGKTKRIITKTIYPDKTSQFLNILIDDKNHLDLAIIDFNTYKQSKNKINRTYRLIVYPEVFNNTYPIIASLELISRKGNHYPLRFNIVKELSTPFNLNDLNSITKNYQKILERLEKRKINSELFTINIISELQKTLLKTDNHCQLITDIITSLSPKSLSSNLII